MRQQPAVQKEKGLPCPAMDVFMVEMLCFTRSKQSFSLITRLCSRPNEIIAPSLLQKCDWMPCCCGCCWFFKCLIFQPWLEKSASSAVLLLDFTAHCWWMPTTCYVVKLQNKIRLLLNLCDLCLLIQEAEVHRWGMGVEKLWAKGARPTLFTPTLSSVCVCVQLNVE